LKPGAQEARRKKPEIAFGSGRRPGRSANLTFVYPLVVEQSSHRAGLPAPAGLFPTSNSISGFEKGRRLSWNRKDFFADLASNDGPKYPTAFRGVLVEHAKSRSRPAKRP